MPHINGTIATGGQPQTLAGGRIPKTYFIKNNADLSGPTGTLIVTDDGTDPSPTNGIALGPGAAWGEKTAPVKGPIRVFSATTGLVFCGKYE